MFAADVKSVSADWHIIMYLMLGILTMIYLSQLLYYDRLFYAMLHAMLYYDVL